MLKTAIIEGLLEVGCDEAGRGSLAGPVFAAAVVLPKDFSSCLINDSKQLSEKEREKAREEIEKLALDFAVASVSPKEIDQINILNASILAMHMALDRIKLDFEHILVDGNRFKTYKNKKHTCVVGGDAKFFSIAAASILAKTYRDAYIKELAKDFPMYGWDKNKAYGTKKHYQAIAQFGACVHHRKSFKLYQEPKLF